MIAVVIHVQKQEDNYGSCVKRQYSIHFPFRDQHKGLFLVSMKEGKTIMVNFNFLTIFFCRIGTPLAVAIFQFHHIQRNSNTLNRT